MTKHYKACDTLIHDCAQCKENEKILIVTDPDSIKIAQAIWDAAEKFPNRSMVMMPTQTMHGQEPPDIITAAMLEADVIFRATKFSISSTDAKRKACSNGARDLNCSDYDLKMLEEGGLTVDFAAQEKKVTKMNALMEGHTIEITTQNGSHFTADITGRKGFPQYGRSLVPGQTSSPPDIECAIGANIGTANGVVFIDGSIPHPKLGLLKEPICFKIKDSKIVDISGGEQAKIFADILASYKNSNVYHIGEIGVGMNPACRLNGRMLEDEGCYGTMHFGVGDDRTFGGTNACPIHLDCVYIKPTLRVDGKIILKDGKLTF
ncbi:hypothetical protein NXG27_07570 [Megasphaera paucivorans]|uniref:Leucyl aminopeptidase (Aminopeptidase T) n=1 Tax=Megasphaera paucivorans TaxID=349095 RepID=A0A1H0AL91_9FIRM|nr:hypothetical protein [Megasphaera paucivorans]SDN34342.1 Leucyl aminopeptidase (aminopeptidase T) [Megasphaera paucivorans]